MHLFSCPTAKSPRGEDTRSCFASSPGRFFIGARPTARHLPLIVIRHPLLIRSRRPGAARFAPQLPPDTCQNEALQHRRARAHGNGVGPGHTTRATK